MRRLRWTQRPVGLWWDATRPTRLGEQHFTIGTVIPIINGVARPHLGGYQLTCNRVEVGKLHPTLERAQAAAERVPQRFAARPVR